jgi:Na+/melibiose symporter-like transporter
MYFIQGVGEPTEGLVAQPVRSLLKGWGCGAAEIGAFAALLALPWWLKPLYGILSDFVPLRGYRRRSYLLLSSGLAAASFLAIYLFPPLDGDRSLLFLTLLLPTVCIAFSDVVVDALLIERGQPAAITGRLQSVQWTALWGATILTGSIGGYLSQHSIQHAGFLICGLLSGLGLALTIAFVKEPAAEPGRSGDSLRQATAALGEAAANPNVRFACAFLFLWSFNPLSTTVLYLHLTEDLGFSEQFYGHTVSLMAVGSLIASGAYGLYCRRISFSLLLGVSVVCGVLATIGYLMLTDLRSAVMLSLMVGFFHMTGIMVQLDLAARSCPVRAAGTVFALIMAVSNLGTSLATWLGGSLYQRASDLFGTETAFSLLVVLGSLITGGCWLLAPLLAPQYELPNMFGGSSAEAAEPIA